MIIAFPRGLSTEPWPVGVVPSDIHGSDGSVVAEETSMNGSAANRTEERAFGRADRSPTGTAETLCPERREASEDTRVDEAAGEGPPGSTASERTPTSERTPASEPASPSGESRFEERLRAVERAVTGTEHSVADVPDGAAAAAEREELVARLDDVEARVEELEAATQALRGYVGSVRAVNREIERRADLALARTSGADSAATDPVTDPGEGQRESVSTVPSEAAINAAIPSEPEREAERGAAAHGGAPRPGGGESDDTRAERCDDRSDDGSWSSSALDRLRESL